MKIRSERKREKIIRALSTAIKYTYNTSIKLRIIGIQLITVNLVSFVNCDLVLFNSSSKPVTYI